MGVIENIRRTLGLQSPQIPLRVGDLQDPRAIFVVGVGEEDEDENFYTLNPADIGRNKSEHGSRRIVSVIKTGRDGIPPDSPLLIGRVMPGDCEIRIVGYVQEDSS